MYTIYEIVNLITGRKYVGMTKNTLAKRWAQHKCQSKVKKSKLYDAIKSYGLDNFEIRQIEEIGTHEECCIREIELIAKNENGYNLACGGQGGFNIINTETWKAKLRLARAGRKPALGLKHSVENKKFFSECGKKRWQRSDLNEV